MKIRDFYDAIMDLQYQLQVDLLLDAEKELQQKPDLWSAPDHKKIQALSATFTLQNYLAGEIAMLETMGVLPTEDEDSDVPEEEV